MKSKKIPRHILTPEKIEKSLFELYALRQTLIKSPWGKVYYCEGLDVAIEVLEKVLARMEGYTDGTQ